MENIRKITDDLYYVGSSDRRLDLFENLIPIPRGISYNSYLLIDEKTVLFDTVDKSVGSIFLENIEAALDGRNLDYIIINHMEPDHAATLQDVMIRYPQAKLVGNAKTFNIFHQFYNSEISPMIIKQGDNLVTGKHTFTFQMAPMVHWPETMVTFDTTDKILFSADAFGMFGAVDGNLFADEIDFNSDWQNDARRYYSNIVGKYGAQVQSLLKAAGELDIKTICPLHGPIWRDNLSWLIEKYNLWSQWQAESDDVLVVYASMYGNTESAACKVASTLCESGKKVNVINICNTDKSYAISEMFRVKNIVLATPTYNGGIYPAMEALVLDMKALMIKDRKIAIIENGTWGPVAAKQIKAIFETMKNIEVTGVLTIKSALKENQSEQVKELCNGLM